MQSSHLEARQRTGQTELRLSYVERGQGATRAGESRCWHAAHSRRATGRESKLESQKQRRQSDTARRGFRFEVGQGADTKQR